MRQRPTLLATACFAATMAAGVGQAPADPLAAFKGRARPVIVLSDSRDDPKVARQIAALDGARPGLDERDVKVLRDAQPGSPLRRQLGVATKGFAVVLVGKDGGVKEVWHDPVDPGQIFTIIDRMPMRRKEMRG